MKAIVCESLSKKFCADLKKSLLYGSTDLLRGMFFGLDYSQQKLRKAEFWALDDVNLEVEQGEVLGILGQNGSGKSTLLRIINGIFPPDRGLVRLNGSLGSLIALGAGFHPHMTGYENIFLNAALLGMKNSEIKSKVKSIIEFADIGDFLNAPVATYSSGMTVRLGFSIAIHSNPDILIIDEVLAVGDYNFQRKCFDKIHELKRNGAAILFVSHSITSIERICSRCMVLDAGKSVFQGWTSDAIDAYAKICNRHAIANLDPIQIGVGLNNIFFSDVRAYGAQHPENGSEIIIGDDIIIEFSFEILNKEDTPHEMRIGIRTPEGRDIQLISFHESTFADHRKYEKSQYLDIKRKGRVRVVIENPRFFPQALKVDLSIARMDRDYHEGGLANATTFQIIQNPQTQSYFEPGSMMVTRFNSRVEYIS